MCMFFWQYDGIAVGINPYTNCYSNILFIFIQQGPTILLLIGSYLRSGGYYINKIIFRTNRV
nr:MAG TPA: hypothetical protein [Caudoviricetes sp.]